MRRKILLYALYCALQSNTHLLSSTHAQPANDAVKLAIKLIEEGNLFKLIKHLQKHPTITPQTKSTQGKYPLIDIAPYRLRTETMEPKLRTKVEQVRDYLKALEGQESGGFAKIYFYDKHDPFYIFTNFWRPPQVSTAEWYILYNNQKWATSEHAFQAAKFKDADGTFTQPLGEAAYNKILASIEPKDAFKIGQRPPK